MRNERQARHQSSHTLNDSPSYAARDPLFRSHHAGELSFSFGQVSEWAEGGELDWWLLDDAAHGGPLAFVAALNRTYRSHAALWERDDDGHAFSRLGAPSWNPDVFAFSRRDAGGGEVVVVANFSGTTQTGYALDFPACGDWREILNSDATEFGGAGVGNLGTVTANAEGRAHLTLPSLGVLWLRRAGVCGALDIRPTA